MKEEKEAITGQPATPEFNNEQVKVSVHRKAACRVELEVEASASLVKPAQGLAIKAVGKEVTLPGFRKGKGPDELVLKNYPSQIDKKWQEAIAKEAFRECQKMISIPTLNGEMKISFNIKSHSTDGAKLILFFETEPQIPPIDPKSLKLKVIERPAVNEEKVDETIRQLQLFFADWRKVAGRPVQEGDFVILDVDVIEEEPARNIFTGVRFNVTDRTMAKWMKDLILGREKNEILEGISRPDESASDKDKEELTDKKVRLTIKDIEEATIPELTDALAQKVGVRSVEEMKKSVEKLLNKQADDHVQEKLREELSEVLLAQFPFDIPSSLIDRETRFRMTQLFKDNDFQAHWNNMTNEAKTRTVTSIAEQSEKAVRMFYLCRKILSDAGIKISPKDIPSVPHEPLNLVLGPKREIDPQENTEVHQAEAYSRLLLEKAEDYLIANAVIA